MTKKILILAGASVVSLMSLSACGRDDNQTWEAIEYNGVPYTEERTAGRGIKYVLAAMAPKKGPVLEPIMSETRAVAPEMTMPAPTPPPPPPMADTEIKNATPIFIEKMIREEK